MIIIAEDIPGFVADYGFKIKIGFEIMPFSGNIHQKSFHV